MLNKVRHENMSIKIETIFKYKIYCIFIFSLLILIIPLFSNISNFPIRMWDEATYANNSIDMMESGNPVVITDKGAPDLYNTKPPFVIWLQAISMKVFGVNELAVRLPSAIFAIFTILIVFLFCVFALGDTKAGVISSLVLLTSKGYISNHVARTGDLDAVLVFWMTFYIFIFILLLLRKTQRNSMWFILLSTGISFAFLSKGSAGFFFLPFLFIISVLFGNAWIYKRSQLYVAAGAVIVVSASFYLLREFLAPGYLNAIYQSEISRLFKPVMSWQIQPFAYYYENLKNYRFNYFFYLLIASLFTPVFLQKNKIALKVFLYLLIIAVGYFFLISLPQVKLEWYDAPLFPLFAVLIGLFLSSFFENAVTLIKKDLSEKIRWIVFGILLLLLFIKPYNDILKTLSFPEKNVYEMEREGALLKTELNRHPEITRLIVVKSVSHPEHLDQVYFYQRAFEKNGRAKISVQSHEDVNKGDFVMTSQLFHARKIDSLYSTLVIDSLPEGVLFKILGKKLFEPPLK